VTVGPLPSSLFTRASAASATSLVTLPPGLTMIPTPDPPSPVPNSTPGEVVNAVLAKFRAALNPARSRSSTARFSLAGALDSSASGSRGETDLPIPPIGRTEAVVNADSVVTSEGVVAPLAVAAATPAAVPAVP